MAERGWGYVDPNQVDELSAIIALDRRIALYPESVMFSTPACRAVIVPQHGIKTDTDYRGRLPLSLDIAAKCALYTGSNTGAWRNQYAFDESPNNHITNFIDINDLYMPESKAEQYWSIGVIWAQNVDRTRAFYPAFSSVYKDDTSVLRGLPFIIAMCQTWKYAIRSWQINVGNSKLTKQQIIDRSNESIKTDTEGKFDGRFIITPDTFYTDADKQRGYSWSCNIKIEGNVMPTVGIYSIKVERRGSIESTNIV